MQKQINENIEKVPARILVVDDSEAYLALLNTWLTEFGFSVVAVNNGYDAICRFNKEDFDLVLTDICMPGLNGNMIAQYIQNVRADVPAVAVTSAPFLANEAYFDLIINKMNGLRAFVTSLQAVVEKISEAPAMAALNKHGAVPSLQESKHEYQVH